MASKPNVKNWKGLFFPVWVGQAFSLFGSSVVDFALIWYLTDQTGSERVLAFSTLLTLVPRMLLGPFAGSLIDRLKRRTVMILADSAVVCAHGRAAHGAVRFLDGFP